MQSVTSQTMLLLTSLSLFSISLPETITALPKKNHYTYLKRNYFRSKRATSCYEFLAEIIVFYSFSRSSKNMNPSEQRLSLGSRVYKPFSKPGHWKSLQTSMCHGESLRASQHRPTSERQPDLRAERFGSLFTF